MNDLGGIRFTPDDVISPLSLAGLKLWLRSDLGITLVGSKVSVWSDQSGNGFDVTQSTDTSRPTYVSQSASFQNLPTLSVAGAQSLVSANTVIAAQPDTIYAVARQSAISGSTNPEILDGITSRQIIAAFSNTGWGIYAGSVLQESGAPSDDTNPHAFASVFNGATSALYLDDHTMAIASGAAGSASLAQISVGGESGGFWVGEIAEIIITAGAATASVRSQVFDYFHKRYGIATS